jgi:hypothetical protein
MSAADAALPTPSPNVYLTSGCLVIAYDWWQKKESQIKLDVQLDIEKCEFFLGNLLARGSDENVFGSTEFFLYEVDCRAAFATAPRWHSFVMRFAEAQVSTGQHCGLQ